MNKMKIVAAMISAVALTACTRVTVDAHTLDESAFTRVEGTMMYVSAGASANTALHLEEYYAVPENILASLVSDNCKIYLDTMEEEGGYLITSNGTAAAGLYRGSAYMVMSSDRRQIRSITKENTIDALSDVDAQSRQIMLHEIGHYVDDNAFGGWEANASRHAASGTEAWQALYTAHAGHVGAMSALSGVNVYNPAEMFATSFAWYISDPASLLTACPEVYAYIEEVVASF